MAFKEVNVLDADTTVSLTGINKKTGKPNPKQVEGYYLGTRLVDSPKSRSGKASLHFFQTETGNLGVWGKTDLDRKLSNAPLGTMMRVTVTGKVPTPNGDMYKFKVEIDEDNRIDPPTTRSTTSGYEETVDGSDVDYDEASIDSDDTSYDVSTVSRPLAPQQPVKVDAARAAKVQALLNNSRNR